MRQCTWHCVYLVAVNTLLELLYLLSISTYVGIHYIIILSIIVLEAPHHM